VADSLVASVIVAAHNEERTVGRTLRALLTGARPGELEVIIVCNGCTDATADVARSSGTGVVVIELDKPSKHDAMRHGDSRANVYPRVYMDADVEITLDSMRRLLDGLHRTGSLAAGPKRSIPREGVSPVVRWYYDVWEQLPQVQSSLFGRGVIAVSRAGNERIAGLPPLMSDDLAMSDAFEPSERIIVNEASVIVRPPRTVGDLLRRRIRAATGNSQADEAGARRADSRTSLRSLARMGIDQPRLITRIPVFLGVTVLARSRARRVVRSGDFTTWQRDESSRTG
jgi:glycosyltransferase involved in cell wall biosynthesis